MRLELDLGKDSLFVSRPEVVDVLGDSRGSWSILALAARERLIASSTFARAAFSVALSSDHFGTVRSLGERGRAVFLLDLQEVGVGGVAIEEGLQEVGGHVVVPPSAISSRKLP